MRLIKITKLSKNKCSVTYIDFWGRERIRLAYPFAYSWRWYDTGKKIPSEIGFSIGKAAEDLSIGNTFYVY